MSDVSNSFSAWETLPEDEPPLCIAVRRPVSPPRHYEAHHGILFMRFRCRKLLEQFCISADVSLLDNRNEQNRELLSLTRQQSSICWKNLFTHICVSGCSNADVKTRNRCALRLSGARIVPSRVHVISPHQKNNGEWKHVDRGGWKFTSIPFIW
ncbi:hypothetical protein RB195_010297 [Necator americanus]|uniref:Uncharacterized protein n=1 Tax=Necator americanus TaxID=51031 RepID=A0ABR1CY32_NECAM